MEAFSQLWFFLSKWLLLVSSWQNTIQHICHVWTVAQREQKMGQNLWTWRYRQLWATKHKFWKQFHVFWKGRKCSQFWVLSPVSVSKYSDHTAPLLLWKWVGFCWWSCHRGDPRHTFLCFPCPGTLVPPNNMMIHSTVKHSISMDSKKAMCLEANHTQFLRTIVFITLCLLSAL